MMKIKCSVYIATSVDGFIAKPGGDIDWLVRPEFAEEKIKGLSYKAFISTIDALVMGRNTYEKALSFTAWPYEGTEVVVLTSKGTIIPDHLRGKVRIESGPPEQIVSTLASEGKGHLYIDGGITIQRFLKARLINDITITRIPILLGEGIPLFGTIGVEQPLRLIDAVASDNGVIQVRYEVQSVA
jgi:dihydrofolate reductase